MRCPALRELPAPPDGKAGWPWTQESPALPELQDSGEHWPKISIVTPSFNQGMYIEETIRSVLLQGYPNLEYIIIDGGSTDNSIDVIKKYERWLTYWVSEKDRGQTHAINKGLALVTGEIFNFINSDDFLSKSSLRTIAAEFGTVHVLAGGYREIYFDSRPENIDYCRNLDFSLITDTSGEFPIWHQPAVWLRPHLIRTLGCYDERYQYLFDTDMVLRYLAAYPEVGYSQAVLATFRWHTQSKTYGTAYGPVNYFLGERLAMSERLLADSTCSAVHPYCRRILRQHGWQYELNQIMNDPTLSRWQRRTRIIALVSKDPAARLGRFSLGHLRHC